MSLTSSHTDGTHGQSLPSGSRLEEFVIEQVLGSGGFGITYLARDSRLGRRVVIKENLPTQFCWRETSSLTVQPRHSKGEDADNFQYSLESFEREASTLASLDHPGIVKVLRSFEAHGTAYFVMPFVEGTALDEALRQRAEQKKAFAENEIKDLLFKVLDALGYLHDRGIYHRDIKPGNILMTTTGEPVLIDFGAARQRLSERSLTVIESAGYTPFEQLQSRGKVGPWSDIYALGSTFYKVITGETPAKAADRIMEDPVLPLKSRAPLQGRYSPRLLESLDRAMAPKAADRFQDTAQWRENLGGGASATPVPAPAQKPGPRNTPAAGGKGGPKPVPAPPRPPPARRPGPRPVVLISSFAALLMIGGFGWWWFSVQGTQRAEPAARQAESQVDFQKPADNDLRETNPAEAQAKAKLEKERAEEEARRNIPIQVPPELLRPMKHDVGHVFPQATPSSSRPI